MGVNVPVTVLGYDSWYWGDLSINVNSANLKKIYFPWTASQIGSILSDKTCFFFANSELYDWGYNRTQVIVPKLYDQIFLNAKYDNKWIVKANITYNFNYKDNPNDGYFFIDLIEETGKLTKPPYDPTREGYNFVGWYKDEGCNNLWNFEKDEVTIEFDENSERIYEEIKLFAKWEKQ